MVLPVYCTGAQQVTGRATPQKARATEEPVSGLPSGVTTIPVPAALVVQPELAEAHIAAGNSLAAIGRDRESFKRFQSARKLESGSR